MGCGISEDKVIGFFLGFCPRSLFLNINGLFPVKWDEYMIVNHEENDAVSYLVLNNTEYLMHVVCAMKLL